MKRFYACYKHRLCRAHVTLSPVTNRLTFRPVVPVQYLAVLECYRIIYPPVIRLDGHRFAGLDRLHRCPQFVERSRTIQHYRLRSCGFNRLQFIRCGIVVVPSRRTALHTRTSARDCMVSRHPTMLTFLTNAPINN